MIENRCKGGRRMNAVEIIERINSLILTCNEGIAKYGIYDDLFKLDKEALERNIKIIQRRKRKKQRNKN